MKNQQIAQIFNEMAQVLELKGESVFRIRAYRRASQNIADLPKDVAACSEEELLQVPGIGKDLAAKIREYCDTGAVGAHDRMLRDVPSITLELVRIPGLGPKTAKMLVEETKIRSIDELASLARAGKLAGLRGIQKKSEENILKGIERISRGAGRHLIGRVLPLADDIVQRIRAGAPVGRIEVAGSIRRRKETVKDIDILCTSTEPDRVMQVFVGLPHVARVLAQGETKSSIVSDAGIQVDLRVVPEESFGAALQYFTGSKEHNIRLRERAMKAGLKVNEYGVFREPGDVRIGGRKEEDVYRALRLPWIAPELREDAGEIEAALEGRLPDLVELRDIRGDLHVHTNWSDGEHDIETLVEAARKREYAYLAVTDHTKGLGVAHGLDEGRFAEQAALIDKINSRLSGFRVLKGAEVDIRADGSLDLPDSCLAGLDVVVASIHSGLKEPQEQITRRILAAIRNPFVSAIGHPTGRLIGERDAYAVDMEAMMREAAQYGVALELNAYPQRLDLSDGMLRMAKEHGAPIMINTDAHLTGQFENMTYGVSMARRGWIEKKDVVNALPLEQLMRRLRAMREGKLKTVQRLGAVPAGSRGRAGKRKA